MEPPYKSSPKITWSPGENKWNTASTAAIPEEKAITSVPSSRPAINVSRRSRVGLDSRVYWNPVVSPKPGCVNVLDI